MRARLVVLVAGVLLGCGSTALKTTDAAADRGAAAGGAAGEGGVGGGGAGAAGAAGAAGGVTDAEVEHGSADAPAAGAGDAGDARSDDVSGGDLASDPPRRDGDAGSCATGCAPENGSHFCGPSEITWVCHVSGSGERVLAAACRDAATNAIRFCCPLSFASTCD
jgi:hypothetical protein